MLRRVGIGAGVVALFAAMVVIGWLASASAEDAPGCDGLSDYREAMMPLAPGGYWQDRDPLTISSDEWAEFAEAAVAYQRALRDITPPLWAEEWHQIRVEFVGLAEQVGKAVSTGGIFLALGFVDSIEAMELREADARERAIAACPDFVQFLDEWDPPDGTPVATPAVP